MACPYFYPTERFGQNLWPHPARLPLGDGYAGLCCAAEGTGFRPTDEVLRQYCNLGYAMRRCGRFPPGDGPDAVRFTVEGEQNGALRIGYALEKDHRPHSHGALEYSIERRAFVAPPASRLLGRQAEAYVESYLRRK